MKCFHLLSDGKTVKEISWEEYRTLANRGWNAKRKYRLLVVLQSGINILYGNNGVFIPMKQLLQALKMANIISEEKQ